MTYCVLGNEKAIEPKNQLFVCANKPARGKFHADFKNDLKKFHTITEGHNFLIELQLQF